MRSGRTPADTKVDTNGWQTVTTLEAACSDQRSRRIGQLFVVKAQPEMRTSWTHVLGKPDASVRTEMPSLDLAHRGLDQTAKIAGAVVPKSRPSGTEFPVNAFGRRR